MSTADTILKFFRATSWRATPAPIGPRPMIITLVGMVLGSLLVARSPPHGEAARIITPARTRRLSHSDRHRSLQVLDEDDLVAALAVEHLVHDLPREQEAEAPRAEALVLPGLGHRERVVGPGDRGVGSAAMSKPGPGSRR